VGICLVDGDFVVGDLVDLCDENGYVVVCGLVNYVGVELFGLFG